MHGPGRGGRRRGELASLLTDGALTPPVGAPMQDRSAANLAAEAGLMEERMGVVEWSRFLATSSFVLASSWERHLEGGGRDSFSACGATSASKEAWPRQPAWGATITCGRREVGDPSPDNPARIVAELSGRGWPTQRLVFELLGDGGEGNENHMLATMNLLDQWADLLRAHCLGAS